MTPLLPLLLALWAFCPLGAPECVFLRDERTVRCRNSTVQEVAESLHVLTAVVRNRPRALEAESCAPGPGHLPRLPFEGGVAMETVRIRRCDLREVAEDAFEDVASSLLELDLSQNQLERIPGAVGRLQALQRLDLSHNRISWVRPDGPLSALNRLLDLELGNNRIGFTEHDGGYHLKGSLPVEEFGLGGAGRHLHSVGLGGNRLSVLPAQLSALPELRTLDLSDNALEQMGSGLSRLRNLRSLDLRSNRLTGVAFDALPDSVRRLDLSENPLHCECALLWLHEWIAGREVQLPPCHAPQHLQGQDLDQVPWEEECPDQNATFRYMAKGSDDAYDVVRLSATPTSITVSWRVRNIRSEGWTVVYRREGDSPYQMTLAPSDERRHTAADLITQTLPDLRPSTRYVICIARVTQARYTVETGKCARAQTTDRPAVWTELEAAGASASAVSVSWKLRASGLADELSYRHEWTVRLRRADSAHFVDVPVYDITTGAETDGQSYEYALGDLAPRSHYEVCLVDVEHRPLEGAPLMPEAAANSTSCATVQTSGHHVLQGAEIAAVAFACVLCAIVCVVTVALCHQRGLLRWKRPLAPESPPPEVVDPPPWKGRERFAGSWNALGLSCADLVARPQFRSFRTLGYRDALTSVTIYSSGFSEC